MKALIYTLYVAAVLMFSAFARAELAMPFSKVLPQHATVKVTEAGINEVTLDLAIEGTLPNRCYPTPLPIVIQTAEKPNVLRLRLTSPIPNTPCPSRVEKYATVVNLPVLVQNARLVIEPNAEYVVAIEGYQYELQVRGSDLLKVPGFVSFH